MSFEIVTFILIGIFAGIAAGLFGIGGGLIIVPALVYLIGFSQHKATGTSLAILLPPVGLAAVLEYYRHDNVDWRAAAVIAVALFFGARLGAVIANRLSGPMLRLIFGIFVVVMGVYTVISAVQKLNAAEQVKRAPAEVMESPDSQP